MEDVSETELDAELAPIVAQEIYVLIKLGKIADAAVLSRTYNIRK